MDNCSSCLPHGHRDSWSYCHSDYCYHGHNNNICWDIEYKSSEYNGLIPIIRRDNCAPIALVMNNTAGGKGEKGDKGDMVSNNILIAKAREGLIDDATGPGNVTSNDLVPFAEEPQVGDIIIFPSYNNSNESSKITRLSFGQINNIVSSNPITYSIGALTHTDIDLSAAASSTIADEQWVNANLTPKVKATILSGDGDEELKNLFLNKATLNSIANRYLNDYKALTMRIKALEDSAAKMESGTLAPTQATLAENTNLYCQTVG